jgi:hypothetical protein
MKRPSSNDLVKKVAKVCSANLYDTLLGTNIESISSS